jgi:hypothetical protein
MKPSFPPGSPERLALQLSVALALQRSAALAQAVVATPLAQAPAQDMAHPQT